MPFTLANVGGRAALVSEGLWYDLERITDGKFAADPMAAITHFDELGAVAAGLGDYESDGDLASASLRAPAPMPKKAFGIGLNYRDHAAEAGAELPTEPIVFSKFPSCIVGPTDDIDVRVETGDYEAELVVVIGRPTRDVAATVAWSHVAGLTCGQDISDRRLQMATRPPQFALGKSRDTYGPIGPVMVSVDSFENPDDLAISCEINGEPRQASRTSMLIYDVPFVISYLSAILTLDPGDLIFTGTPAGVGFTEGKWLRDGDEIRTEIEGIGTMVNRCRLA